MLIPEPYRYQITDIDQSMFRRLVREDHPLAIALREIDWEGFRPVLESYYSRDKGQPAIDPVRILKLEFLRYQYNLSDREVIERAGTDLAFRFFLQVGLTFRTPDPSLLCQFRGRLGVEGFRGIFDGLVAQARRSGLVKDRLRLKDASHVIASIAVPTTLALVAATRQRLLKAAEPFDPVGVAGQQVEVDLLRTRTAAEPDVSRLEARVRHLREIVAWTHGLPAPDDAATSAAWQKLQQMQMLAEKILHDRDHPTEGRKTLSVTDPEARRGKHGAYYDGYVTDILMDADSELITQINVLEAGGDEAQDAVKLLRDEIEAHGNQVGALSIDGAGFHGPMLRELEGPAGAADPEAAAEMAEAPAAVGLGVTTYVPPKTEPASARFPASAFTIHGEGTTVTCPAGQTSHYRQRDNHSTTFRFNRQTCDVCPLIKQCVAKPGQGAFGRSVTKNDYEREYQRARRRAKTAAFAAVRREHPAVERKLNEVMNHHGGRHARYWGLAKVWVQETMTCFVVNVKRISRLSAELRASNA